MFKEKKSMLPSDYTISKWRRIAAKLIICATFVATFFVGYAVAHAENLPITACTLAATATNNHVEFVIECDGDDAWVYVDFGDGSPGTDTMITNGKSESIGYDYSCGDDIVDYTARVVSKSDGKELASKKVSAGCANETSLPVQPITACTLAATATNNHVEFVIECDGDDAWVYVDFGDGSPGTDTMITNGKSESIGYDYSCGDDIVNYTARVVSKSDGKELASKKVSAGCANETSLPVQPITACTLAATATNNHVEFVIECDGDDAWVYVDFGDGSPGTDTMITNGKSESIGYDYSCGDDIVDYTARVVSKSDGKELASKKVSAGCANETSLPVQPITACTLAATATNNHVEFVIECDGDDAWVYVDFGDGSPGTDTMITNGKSESIGYDYSCGDDVNYTSSARATKNWPAKRSSASLAAHHACTTATNNHVEFVIECGDDAWV
jgi:hypothetical protein